ncbi:competence type IV pilus minor pilin ComGF [Lactobacillus jensenii]|uniref:competence type IV pilus minor pilin ComGF n=1 Tax=Lactobacillus jensenii TaxID=109790 RepID=UPI00286FFCE6|nr:competence type IV pilus minor pilin ComGF [Lactobacillus jensenii]
MKIKQVKGFLLVEAIISIAITLLCLMMLTNLLGLFKQYRQVEHYGNELVLSYVQLNNFIETSDYIEIDQKESNSKKVIFKREEAGKVTNYVLEYYNKSMLRLTASQGGHIPLLMKVKQSDFDIDGQKLKVRITEWKNGESECFFDLSSKNKPADEKMEQDDKSQDKR